MIHDTNNLADMSRCETKENNINQISTEVKNKLLEKVENLLQVKQKLVNIYHETKDKLKQFNDLRDENKFYDIGCYQVLQQENFINNINRTCWKNLLYTQEVKEILPKKRFEELIYQTTFPDFNSNIIINTLNQLYEDKDKYIIENIIYCFQILDKKNYKTNSSYSFKNKSILNIATYRDYSGCGRSYYVSDYYINALIALESLFAKIDSTEIQDKESIRLINNYEKYASTNLELKYFKLKVYKNGNIHIYYKDETKINMLNKILQNHFGNTLAG